MAFLPKLRPRRSDLAFLFIRFLTIGLVVAQLWFIGRDIPDFSRSGDTLDTTAIGLYTAKLFNLVALVPTVMACYLRPATLRRWSLSIGMLCGIDIGLSVAIQICVTSTTAFGLAMACVTMVVQAIYIGIRWFSYWPADYDEPILRLETLNAESEGNSAPLVRKTPEYKVRSSNMCHAMSGTNRSPPPAFLPTAHLKLLLTLCPDSRHCVSSCNHESKLMHAALCYSLEREADPLASNSTVKIPSSTPSFDIGPNTHILRRSKAC